MAQMYMIWITPRRSPVPLGTGLYSLLFHIHVFSTLPGTHHEDRDHIYIDSNTNFTTIPISYEKIQFISFDLNPEVFIAFTTS